MTQPAAQEASPQTPACLKPKAQASKPMSNAHRISIMGHSAYGPRARQLMVEGYGMLLGGNERLSSVVVLMNRKCSMTR